MTPTPGKVPTNFKQYRLLNMGTRKTFNQSFAELKEKADRLGIVITQEEINALILVGSLLSSELQS